MSRTTQEGEGARRRKLFPAHRFTIAAWLCPAHRPAAAPWLRSSPRLVAAPRLAAPSRFSALPWLAALSRFSALPCLAALSRFSALPWLAALSRFSALPCLAALLAATLLLGGCRDKPREAPGTPEPARKAADVISAGPGAAQPIDDDGRQVFLPHVTEEMLTADFWIDRMAEAEPPSSPGEVRLTPHWTRLTPDRARLTPDEVAAYSRLVLESSNGALQDLAAFPESLPRDELLRRTTSWKPGDPPFFRDGLEIDRTELDAVALNRNEAGILDSNP
ncbi:MAG: hypothetical protein FJ109_16610, partial [Deltaproteobacteria bacterium]|nr:hypothetical protein [Deltaproteobacteria bacterium]